MFWYTARRRTPPEPVLVPSPPSPRLVLARPCLGVDLAGLEHRETGIAVIEDGRLACLRSAGSDREILELATALGRRPIVAVNAPLSLPRGRCCLDDDCRCRHEPGTRSRAVERLLAHERVPTLATALIKVLARRGIRLAATLRGAGFEVLEAYPYATLRLLGLPTGGKRSRAGRRRIHEALAAVVPGLDHPDATEHQLDAVVCALTADLWQRGHCRLVGDPDEGQMVVPLVGAARPGGVPAPPLRRAAETSAPYTVTPNTVAPPAAGDGESEPVPTPAALGQAQ